jgi:hypothetical protein
MANIIVNIKIAISKFNEILIPIIVALLKIVPEIFIVDGVVLESVRTHVGIILFLATYVLL